MACNDTTEPIVVWVTDRYVRECTIPEWGEQDSTRAQEDQEFASCDLIQAESQPAVWITAGNADDETSASFFCTWFGRPSQC